MLASLRKKLSKLMENENTPDEEKIQVCFLCQWLSLPFIIRISQKAFSIAKADSISFFLFIEDTSEKMPPFYQMESYPFDHINPYERYPAITAALYYHLLIF